MAHKERIDLTPISIAYEPSYMKKFMSFVFFTDQIYMAYRSYIGQFEKGEERITNRTVKQCYYCENFFVKNDLNMKKHL